MTDHLNHQVSASYEGPLVIFTPEELRKIHAWAMRTVQSGTGDEVHRSIQRKVERKRVSDPKLTEPGP